MAAPPPKVLFGLVCDDVRSEDNGKLIIIGVYPSDIIVQTFPARLALTLALNIEIHEAGDLKFEVEVWADQVRLHEGKGIIGVDAPGPGMLPLRFPVALTTPATLRFRFRSVGTDWQDVTQIPVKLRPTSPSASAPSLPSAQSQLGVSS